MNVPLLNDSDVLGRVVRDGVELGQLGQNVVPYAAVLAHERRRHFRVVRKREFKGEFMSAFRKPLAGTGSMTANQKSKLIQLVT